MEMNNKEVRILKYERRLLKNEKSWRRARIGAIILFLVIFIVTFFSLLDDDLISKDEKHWTLIFISVWCFFWLALIDFLNIRIKFIDSINLHHKDRSKEADNQGQSPIK